MAPLAPGFTLLGTPGKVSPMMNQADGVWNMGESTEGADLGGALGADLTLDPAGSMPTFVPLLAGSNGWDDHPRDVDAMEHYVGSFRRPPPAPVPDDETRASFEVVTQKEMNSDDHVVVAIFTLPTFGPPSAFDALAPHQYPGNPAYHDLVTTDGKGVHVDLVKRNLNQGLPYKIVGAQFTPRTSNRPMVFTMQRLRQVRRAALMLLAQRYGIEEDHVAFLVSGASFGGFTSTLAPLFYPQEFHAASGGAFSAAVRSMPSDYDGHLMFASTLGFAARVGYTMRDTLELPMWCRQEETDFASVSITNRLKVGHLQRPVHFYIGDEDAVTHGTDWVQVLHGQTKPDHSLEEFGATSFTNVFSNPVYAYWSVVPKHCHGGDRQNVFWIQIENQPPEQTDNGIRPVEIMAQKAYEQLGVAAVPITHPQLGRKIAAAQVPTLPSLDPSRPALAHTGYRATATTYSRGSNASLLAEHVGFKRYGQGTLLGADDSLKVASIGEDRDSIFVGSADGYVTRLKMENRGSGPVIQPLVEQARSNIGFLPYALGYATLGLDVGEVDPAFPGPEVVVASYNRVALFKASTLELIREVTLPSWEYDQPRKVQIADVMGEGNCEIVFRTYHGHLVVMDKDLQIQYEHGEGGILDLAIFPTPTRESTWLKRPIYLLSARGHVVRLELDGAKPYPTFTDAGVLAGASTLQYGGLRDLDVVTYQGQQHLAALFMPQLGNTDAVRFFSANDCSKIGEFGNLTNPPPPPENGEEPTSVAQSLGGDPTFCYVADHGGDRYAIWSGGEISVWDGQVALGHKALNSFAPATGEASMQAGDIDPETTGQEIVVATAAGKVVWLKLSDLLDVHNTTLPLTRTFVTDSGAVFEDRCNTSLGATWAMAAEPAIGSTPGRLRVVDQVGTWFDVDPTNGNPTWFSQQSWVQPQNLVPAMAPNGFTIGAGTAGEDAWATQVDGPEIWLRANPYVPSFLEPPFTPWHRPPSILHSLLQFRDGHWLFPAGSVYVDTTPNPDRVWCAWWSEYIEFNDLIQSATYELPLPGQPATVSATRASTQDVYMGGLPPPRWPTPVTGFQPLRTEIGTITTMNMQALKLGKIVSADGVPQIVASAMGGRVLVLNADDCQLIAESKDYGLGGMALAVGNLDNDAEDEIVFAPLYSPMPHTGQKVRSHLHVLEWQGGGLGEVGSTVPVGDVGSDDFLGYGTCGIAIADVPTHGKLVFVTTVNGELAVFKPLASGALDPDPVFRTVVEGSIGAFGSIVVANLVPDTQNMPEVYLGGSSGIRRFDFQ